MKYLIADTFLHSIGCFSCYCFPYCAIYLDIVPLTYFSFIPYVFGHVCTKALLQSSVLKISPSIFFQKTFAVSHLTFKSLVHFLLIFVYGMISFFCMQIFTCASTISPLCNLGIFLKVRQPNPVFLPGESHGRRSLEGYSPRGRKESDTTERLHFSLTIYVSLFPGSLFYSIGLYIFLFFFLIFISLAEFGLSCSLKDLVP